MAKDSIPPYYEVVGLLHPTDDATLKACLKYRNTPAPDMSLSWLRQTAYKVLSGQFSLAALERTIENKLPPNAWPSVKLAVKSLVNFASEKAWVGERLPDFMLEVGRGFVMPVRAAGRFHSKAGRWVAGLQPRLDGAPDLIWQAQTWLALLNEAYCTDPLAPAIPLLVDVSRDPVTRKRSFNAIEGVGSSLIGRDELNARMNRFIDCYLRAVELVPVRPRRERRRPEDEEHPWLPGLDP